MKHRHRARRIVMQALCCLDAQGPDAMDLAAGFIREARESLDVIVLAQQMLTDAWAFCAEADALLTEYSNRWDVHRMPVVDRNILRLSVWELSADRAPAKVVINEAVRLAKEFSTADSPRFINGVLDAVARGIEGADSSES